MTPDRLSALTRGPARSRLWPLSTRTLDILSSLALVAWLGLGGVGIIERLWSGPAALGGALFWLSDFANLAFMALLAVLLVIRRPPVLKAPGLAPRLAGAAGFAIPALAALLPRAPLGPVALAISTTLMLIGSIASIFVCFWLGRSFALFPQARALVTGGPYRWVRHPLYLAETIAVVGYMAQFAMPWSLAFLGIALVTLVARMIMEEQVLGQAFPEYVDYARRTARLIPGLY